MRGLTNRGRVNLHEDHWSRKSRGVTKLQFFKLMYWASLIAWIAAALCGGIIGLRNSVWYGSSCSLFAKLQPIDIKMTKVAGILFVVGMFFFIIKISS